MSYDDLGWAGSKYACKENGRLRSEGEDYIRVVQEGDVILFRSTYRTISLSL